MVPMPSEFMVLKYLFSQSFCLGDLPSDSQRFLQIYNIVTITLKMPCLRDCLEQDPVAWQILFMPLGVVSFEGAFK